MSIALFFLINLLIFVAHYCFTIRLGLKSLAERIITAGLFFLTQIIMLELCLGIAHVLYLPALCAGHILISVSLIAYSAHGQHTCVSSMKNDLSQFGTTFRKILNPANSFLLILLFFLSIWMLLASLLLPVRGVDDLSYHFAVIAAHIINHSIHLLDPNFFFAFAYPGNAELLFLWPAIFFHSHTLVGMTQFTVGLWGILLIYALARILQINPRLSAFIALLFLFCPVVLIQSGSGYIDVICTAFILAVLYYANLFFLKRNIIYLYLCGIATGVALGLKYNMVLFVGAAHLLILIPLISKHRRHIPYYLLTILLLGGYWYFRNWIVLGSPLYPLDPFSEDMGIFVTQEAVASADQMGFFEKILRILVGLIMKDVGLRSVHGGLGLVFWGMAFPCWALATADTIWKKQPLPKQILWVLWLQVLIGFGLIFIMPLEVVYLNIRYAIPLVAISFLAMGLILQKFELGRPIYASFIKLLACIFSFLSFVLLSTATIPSYRIDLPIKERLNNEHGSKLRYLQLLPYKFTPLFHTWEALDTLTQDAPKGVVCYYSPHKIFQWTAPVYGSRFQNKVWNLMEDRSGMPDAFIFNYDRDGEGTSAYNKKYELSDVAVHPDYQLIIIAPSTGYLFIRNDYLDMPQVQKAMVEYFQYHFNEVEDLASEIRAKIDEKIPIIGTDAEINAFRYYKISGQINNPVIAVPAGFDEKFVRNKGWQEFYSLNNPVDGYQHTTVAEVENDTIEFTLLKNTAK